MIDKRTLEFILIDQQEELEAREADTLCRRPEEQLVDLKSTQAQVVIGVRRSGKSTLCYQALHHSGVKFAYVNFDDERLADMQASQLNDLLEILYKIQGDFSYLFLDEIQNVEGWYLFVNRLLRKKMHVIITGSNAKLLSGELATHLSGRNKEIPLFPFSFAEYCTMHHVDTERRSTKSEAFRRAAFDQYMKQGGFPEMLTIQDNQLYVRNLMDNILKRDIEQRYKIQYKAAFEQLAHHILNVAPTIVSTSELCRIFGLKSEHTVKNYIDYLKQAYMLVGIPKYAQKSKLRMGAEKLYPIDVALMNQRDNAFAGENLGHRLETIVLVHLMRSCKLKGYDIYFLNERSGECDFLVCNGNQVKQAIQVSYDISSEKTCKREIKGLLLAATKTNCTDLLLLTDHEYADREEAGYTIRIRPVYEWSLER
ncbi:MAG: ATP-binding protein [bacterium]|nr:ATP-binding protein [bacterium]